MKIGLISKTVLLFLFLSVSFITYAPVNSQSSLPSDTALVTQILDISLYRIKDTIRFIEQVFRVDIANSIFQIQL